MFAGLGAIAYYRYPQYFGALKPYEFISACGLLGAGIQQGIAKVLNFILGPIGRLLVFYENLLELEALKERKSIDKQTHSELVQKLCEKRFLH